MSGSKVVISGHASRESLQEYYKYRSKGLPLKCPCNYAQGYEVLKVVKYLTSTLVLLQPISHPRQLTIAVKSDLTFV